MKRSLLSFMLLLVWGLTLGACDSYTPAACIAPETFALGTVKIEKPIPLSSAKKRISFGSGWFSHSKQILITNWHVVKEWGIYRNVRIAVHLSQTDANGKLVAFEEVQAWVLHTDEIHDLVLLALDKPFTSGELLHVRHTPVYPSDLVLLSGFGGGTIHTGKARVSTKDPDIGNRRGAYGHIPLFIEGETNRTAFSKGASGSPVRDCKGDVVGVFSSFDGAEAFTSDKDWLRPTKSDPNGYAVRIKYLESLYDDIH